MKTILKKLLAIIIIIILNSSFGFTQSKGLEKLMSNDKKLHKSIHTGGFTNQIKKWQIKKGLCKAEDYKLPQKIGLLTFVVSDKSQSSSTSSGAWTTTSTRKATKDGVSYVATNLYDNTIEGMKKSFSDRGMQLLEIDEYLDTDQKIALYNNYELKKLKGLKAIGNVTGQGNSGPAIGYRDMWLARFGSFPKAVKKRDAFFNELDLDAVLVVTIGMSVVGNYFHYIEANLLYRNPAAGTKTAYGLYNEGGFTRLKVNEFEKKPPFAGILLTEQVEYKNKRGKTKKRMEAVGVDPNFYKVINIVVDRAALGLEGFVNK